MQVLQQILSDNTVVRLNKGKDDPVANEERQEAQVRLNEAREAIEQLNAFYQVLLDREDNFAQNQVLGKVILSPPIGVGVGREGYTRSILEASTSIMEPDVVQETYHGEGLQLIRSQSYDVQYALPSTSVRSSRQSTSMT